MAQDLITETPEELLNDLKKSLQLQDHTISSWAKELKNPDLESITRTNVYHAINHGTPEWLAAKINSIVSKAKKNYPELFNQD